MAIEFRPGEVVGMIGPGGDIQVVSVKQMPMFGDIFDGKRFGYMRSFTGPGFAGAGFDEQFRGVKELSVQPDDRRSLAVNPDNFRLAPNRSLKG